MRGVYVLDTHVLVWYLGGERQLSERAWRACDDKDSLILIPTITILEACNMIGRGRAFITQEGYFRAIDADPRIRFLPLDYQTARSASELTELPELHDRLIVASAMLARERYPGLILLTRDARIRSTKHVQVEWE